MKKNKLNLWVIKILFTTIQISLLLINICFLSYEKANIQNGKKKINEKLLLKFKNSDYFFLNIINKNYKEIANYLNNKYKYAFNINLTKRRISVLKQFFFPEKRKKISLYSVDLFSITFHKKWLKDKLKEKFIIKFNKNNPDYLLFNVFGNEHLNPKYDNSIKLFYFFVAKS